MKGVDAMDEFLRNALIRKLATAEGSGNSVLANRIRARLAKAVPKREPEPDPELPAPDPIPEAVPEPETADDATEPEIPAAGPEPVAFASPQAEEIAAEFGLGPKDFNFVQSGKTGFTVADVKRAAEITEEDD